MEGRMAKQIMETDDNFSLIEHSFDIFARQVEDDKRKFAMVPFTELQTTPEAKKKRILAAFKSFEAFDKVYFPPEVYGKGRYAKPNKMIKDIIKVAQTPGIHIVFGPRKHGKTATGKKYMVWALLTGRVSIAGTYAETLHKSSNILRDIASMISDNERIVYDFQPEFIEDNGDQFQFRISIDNGISSSLPDPAVAKSYRYCCSFSEGRSVRGYTRLLGRPELLLGDDVETLESSFAAEPVHIRRMKLIESFHSMEDESTFIIMANDFSTASALHQLRTDYEKGLLQEKWHIYVYRAWARGPLWKEKYPAKTESELKSMVGASGESDWQANFQMNPIPPEGDFFKTEDYKEYKELPTDVRGVIYCDPNLSKKGKGDTTAITPLLYSPTTDVYYITQAVCRSFSDSNDLLDTVLGIKQSLTGLVSAVAFDGNVTQESTWTQFVRNWCKIKRMPYPYIEYKRYKVNDLAKNLQMIYSEGRLLFPAGFSLTQAGEKYLAQFFAFTGTKTCGKDDAPDSAICAFEFIHERHLTRRVSRHPVVVIDDYYLI